MLLFVVAAFFIIAPIDRLRTLGGVANSRVTGTAPVAKNDAMQAVSQDEASKRATVNAEEAARAQGRNQAYVAQPVIVATEPPRQPEQPPAPPTAVAAASRTSNAASSTGSARPGRSELRHLCLCPPR